MDIIEKYLSAQLITAQTDEELTKIEACVDRITKIIAHKPVRFSAALHCAVSPHSDAAKPMLDEVYGVVREEWRTVSSRYPTYPVQLLRVIVLGAAVSLARKDEKWADAFGIVLPALVHFLEPNSADSSIWQGLIDEFQTRYEHRAEEYWSVPGSVEVPRPKVDAAALAEISIRPGSIDSDALEERLLAVFSNSGVEGANQHTPNQHPHWAKQASKNLAIVLANDLPKQVCGSVEGPDLSKFADAFLAHAENSTKKLLEAVRGQDLSLIHI